MKKELTEEQIERIVEMIEDGDFDQETSDVEFDGQLTYIRVDEEDGDIRAYYGFMDDGPKYSVPDPTVTHKVRVGEFTFMCEEVYDNGFDMWECEECDNVDERIEEALNDNCERGYPDYPDGDEQFDNDWTAEELVAEIESQLSSDEYIEIDGEYHALDGSAEEFLEELFDGDEESIEDCDYSVVSRHDLAVDLADNIECCY